MPATNLSAMAARRALERVGRQLGQADRERLERLPPLIGADGCIRLGDALTALFPGHGWPVLENAAENLRRFMEREAAGRRLEN